MPRSFKILSAEPDTPLKGVAPNGRDVLAWLHQAQLKITDAGIEQVSLTTRLDAAYDAVLFCCLAVASAQGYRAGSEKGHHIVVLEGAAHAVGLSQTRFDELDTLRDWRSRKYRSGFKVEPQEVDEAIAIATPFLAEVAEWFAAHHANLLKQATEQSKQ